MSDMNGLVAPTENGAWPVLVAEDLRKSYGPRRALRGLSFSLNVGRVLGFLGPNGAGKTTAIRILTTIQEPTAGRFVVDGVNGNQPDKVRRKIGALPESLGFPKQATAIEYLAYFGQLYGRTARDAKSTGLRLLEEVGLHNRAHSLIGGYSRGMRQRLGIARALVNDPVVVFLDEPTLGLDPRGQQELLGMIRRIVQNRRASVVLCSHLLTEIEGVCDDVVIMNAGQVVAQGTADDVLGRSQQHGLSLQVPLSSVEKAKHVLEALPSVIKTASMADKEDWLKVELAPPASNATEDATDTAHEQRQKNSVLEALLRAEVPILRFEAGGHRLQDVFLQLTDEAIT
jgi:ABC-2 type transport system ATP-binding protein